MSKFKRGGQGLGMVIACKLKDTEQFAMKNKKALESLSPYAKGQS
jgi:hypothetical protein